MAKGQKRFIGEMAEKIINNARERVDILFPEGDPESKERATEIFAREMMLDIEVRHLKEFIHKLRKRKGVR